MKTEDDTFRVLARPTLPELANMVTDFLSSLDNGNVTMNIKVFVESKGYSLDEWAKYQLDLLSGKVK